MPPTISSKSRVSQFVAKRIYELSGTMTQSEIAAKAGFASPNMLSMIKDGRSKLPLERAVGLAIALDCNASELVWLALTETLPPSVLTEITTKRRDITTAGNFIALAAVAAAAHGEVHTMKSTLETLAADLQRVDNTVADLKRSLARLVEQLD